MRIDNIFQKISLKSGVNSSGRAASVLNKAVKSAFNRLVNNAFIFKRRHFPFQLRQAAAVKAGRILTHNAYKRVFKAVGNNAHSGNAVPTAAGEAQDDEL